MGYFMLGTFFGFLLGFIIGGLLMKSKQREERAKAKRQL